MRPLTLILLLPLLACGAKTPEEIVFAGNTMGTQFSVKLVTASSDAATLEQRIQASLDSVDKMMSTYKADSEISAFNASRSTDWFAVSKEFCTSVDEALLLSEITDGAFDITVAPLVNLWGFGPGAMVDTPPADDEIQALLARVGYRHLAADCAQPALRKDLPGLELDMSACGKGLAIDEIAELLNAQGIENYMVEVGGEIRLRGRNIKGARWAIGIERPLTSERQPHTIVHLTDTALATSGDYRNFFESDGKLYSHTIDTATGKPVTHTLASVTVVDPSGYRADALATALLVLGPEKGMALAVRENMAALFLSRGETGIKETASPAFRKLSKS